MCLATCNACSGGYPPLHVLHVARLANWLGQLTACTSMLTKSHRCGSVSMLMRAVSYHYYTRVFEVHSMCSYWGCRSSGVTVNRYPLNFVPSGSKSPVISYPEGQHFPIIKNFVAGTKSLVKQYLAKGYQITAASLCVYCVHALQLATIIAIYNYCQWGITMQHVYYYNQSQANLMMNKSIILCIDTEQSCD